MQTKKKPAPLARKQEQVNKNAIYWAACIFVLLVLGMSLLLILNGS